MTDEPLIDEAEADSAGAAELTRKMNETTAKAADDFLRTVVNRAKEDADFADLLRKELEAAKIFKMPSWIEPISLFEANLNFGGADVITIAVTTFGNRMKSALSVRMVRMQQALDRSERKMQPLIDAGKADEIDADELQKRNDLIYQLGVAQVVETYAGLIVSGCGRFNKLGELRRLATSGKEGDFLGACALVESIPQKVMDMMGHAIRLMNNYGLDSKEARGN